MSIDNGNRPMHTGKTWRRRLAGIALMVTVVSVALSTVAGLSLDGMGGGAAWLAGVLVWPDAARGARRQAVVLLLAGAVAAGIAARLGAVVDLQVMLSGNAPLLAMLAAVGFLRLITAPVSGDGRGRALPRGRAAVVRTLAGLHLFGSVVNMATVFIMAARMAGASERLDRAQLRVLTQGFSAAALWSPFFAAMAAVLTYAPGAHVGTLVAVGLPVAAIGLAFSAVSVLRDRPQEFSGYPMNWGSLRLPLGLGAIIIAVHSLAPSISILGLIAATVPILAVAVMVWRREPAAARFARHVGARLPAMANELWLFLAAGVMASGFAALVRGLPVWLPFDGFGGPQAAGVLAVTVLLAIVGVHQIVSVALFATVLAPLDPDPTLLAMTFLAAWSIGMCVSPLGGMNMALQGAYGVTPREILRANGGYALAMFAVTATALSVYARLT